MPALLVDASPPDLRCGSDWLRGPLLRLQSSGCGNRGGTRPGNWYRRRRNRHGYGLPRVGGALIPFAEDHFARRRLQHGCDRNVDGLANHLAGVVDDHHGAVIQIGDALVVFLAFLQDEDAHGFAGEHDRLQRIGQFVDVQHLDSLQLCHLVQVEVVGDNFAFVELGQFDQFEVNFADGRKIVFHDLNGEGGDFLQALQDVEAAAAAITLQRVGGISDELQLAQHELRRHDDAVEEAGLSNVGDAPVDDDAGVENFVAFFAGLLAAEDPA